MIKGRSIYFTEQELKMILKYMNEAINILGESENNYEDVDTDMNNGLGSAMRKLYKGRNGERIYAKYKTRR